jgi:hypothetical protein
MKRTFTYDEIQFLYALLKTRIESPEGCHIPGTDIKCPYWKIHEDPDSPTPGECTMKKQNRVCTKLELPLVDESLILEVREKKTDDYLRELEEELRQQKTLLSQVNLEMRNLNTDRQNLQEAISKIEKRKDHLLKGLKNEPIDSDE